MDDRKLRVAQWATGHTGVRTLKAVIHHPDLKLLVGCSSSRSRMAGGGSNGDCRAIG